MGNNTMSRCVIAAFLLICSFSEASWVRAAMQMDAHVASVSCVFAQKDTKALCDYRHVSTVSVKNVSLRVGTSAVQIPEKGISVYPALNQTTAVLILIDVSDPHRKNTVAVKNRKAAEAIVSAQLPHQKIGLAVFDSDMRVLAPIGADAESLKNAVSSVDAAGQSTEFYKSILSGIALLKTTSATRKALVVMSDGKDEDRAYTHADVIKAALEADVAILGLGYLERPSDTPFLQTLKRLGDETHGLYFDATEQVLPEEIAGRPFAFVERGGRVTFDATPYWGLREVTLVLGLSGGGTLDLKTNLVFPDKRTRMQQISDALQDYWRMLIGVVALLLVIGLGVVWYVRRRKARTPLTIEYAFLDEMDGSGTRYTLTKTAVCIGRSEHSDIRLSNDSISSNHAEIHRRREGSFYIVDLASANGVYVNDAKVSQLELRDGDLIELGEVRLRFVENTH